MEQSENRDSRTLERSMLKRKLALRWSKGALAMTLGALVLTACDRDDSAPPSADSNPTVDTRGAGGGSNGSNAQPASKPTTAEAPTRTTSFTDSFHDITGPVQPDKLTAKVIQTVAAFNHPASCAVSLDGRFLFVTNASSTLNGLQYNKGSISKLAIDADGRLKMVKNDFVSGLHAPMGIAALPKATGHFPAGSIFVSTGTTSGIDQQGQRIDDITRFNPGVSIFDPETGKLLGFIPMGAKRAVALTMHHSVLAPAGLTFDPQGDLYICDEGNTGRDLEPEIIGRPGVLKIPNANIDAFAQDQQQGEISYLPVLHVPSAVFYSKVDDAIYWTTSDGQGGGGGAVYRSPRANFPDTTMVSNVIGGLGPLMGVVITPGGALIASRIDGDLALINKRIMAQVGFYEDASFSSPGDIKLLTLRNGYNILYVPEQEPNSDAPSMQRVRVVLLPTGI
jgi:DNA-binding beta-propeller fold protein YncE